MNSAETVMTYFRLTEREKKENAPQPSPAPGIPTQPTPGIPAQPTPRIPVQPAPSPYNPQPSAEASSKPRKSGGLRRAIGVLFLIITIVGVFIIITEGADSALRSTEETVGFVACAAIAIFCLASGKKK